ELYAKEFYGMRKRKGLMRADAERMMKTNNYYGSMQVALGDADGLVSGVSQHFPETIRPALQVIGVKNDVKTIAGIHMLVFKNQTLFVSDAIVNIEPTAEELAEIAILAARTATSFEIEPR